MVERHHWINGHESEQTPGDSEGQGSLACCSPGGCKESDTTEPLKATTTFLERIFSLLNIFYLENEIYLLKCMFLPAALNFYLNVFSSQERKTFGGNFPQLSNDYLPAKNTPPLAIKLVYFPRTIISFWLYLWVFKKNIFMRFYFNKILGKGFIAWLLSKTVVLKSSELPGGLAHNQRFWFSERGLKICISNKSLSDSQATHSETKLWEPLF